MNSYLVTVEEYKKAKEISSRSGAISLDSENFIYPWIDMPIKAMTYIAERKSKIALRIFKAWKFYIIKKYGIRYYFFAKKAIKLILDPSADLKGVALDKIAYKE